MDEQQLLRDPTIQPTPEVIAAGLGEAGATYARFLEALADHGLQVDWRYYQDGKAWLGKGLYKWATARGTQKEMTAFWLSIWDGFFKVGFFFPERVRADVLALPLSDETGKKAEDSKPIGKMKTFPLSFDLRTDDLFDDVFTLIEYKKTLK